MLNNVNIIALFSATLSTLAEVAINHPDNGNSEEENRLFMFVPFPLLAVGRTLESYLLIE